MTGDRQDTPRPQPLRPTVISVAPRQKPPAAAKARKPADLPPVAAPTVIPGTAPVRLAVDEALLKRLGASARPEAVEACAEMLRSIVPAHLTDRSALTWGGELQVEHGRLVQEHLDLMRDPVLREAPEHLARLHALLARMDIEALARPAGLFDGAFRRASRVIDTPDDLVAARTEIDQLLRLLAGAQDRLLDLKTRLDRRAETVQRLGVQVEAAGLSALYLSETAAAHLRRAFHDRRESLAMTLLQVRSADVAHQGQGNLPGLLVAAIQNIAHVGLPAWLERLALFQNKLASDRLPTQTEARELGFRLHDLLRLFPQTE